MKILLLSCVLLIGCLPLPAQIRLKGVNQKEINPALLEGRWKARWISLPGEPINIYGVYHFRKSFSLEQVPGKFIVHVSADNRYKLFVNGTQVSLGPARGDVYNWAYETVDLAPLLRAGKNVLAAVVWNYAEKKPVAQMSNNQTGFILQGNSPTEEVVNTDQSWLCIKDRAYSVWTNEVSGYYAAGPGELIDCSLYPWGWEKPEYNDSSWQKAQTDIEGAAKGARDYPGRLLVPRPIPSPEMQPIRFADVRVAEGITCPKDFPGKPVRITIPANSKVRLLLDQKKLTTGYLSLTFSKGKGSSIVIGYAEGLYEGEGMSVKGNRNEVKDKRFVGFEDKLIADGGENRTFTSLWWRTWRYVNIRITTGSEPLVLEDVSGTFTAYPFKNETSFKAPGYPELNDMLEIGWRTARLCANETYMDCPYYEQLQYFGDTRIQTMISLYTTRDTFMVKNALEQGRQSIVADGITMSRYPSSTPQFIASYSLSWIGMGYDYWMFRGDEVYLKSLLPAYRGILSWYEQWLKPDYSLDFVPYWFFADWSAGFPSGEPVREKNGNSSYQDLMYILTLEEAASMEDKFGLPSMAAHYREIASKIKATIRPKYWDEGRGLFADTHDHRSYSQHVNALAVLAGVVTGEEAAKVMTRSLEDKTIAQATIYFRYYVHMALRKAGLGDKLLDNLQIWRDQMALGLTTWAEQPEPSRSDCHAWGASLNVDFYRTLLGIDSEAPGFKRVRVAPSLGSLKEVSGTMPHPDGFISVSYKINKKGELTARVELPDGIGGTFVWKGKSYPLNEGVSEFHCDDK